MKREMMNMISRHLQKASARERVSVRGRGVMMAFAIPAMWATIGACTCLAQQPAQETFPSAAEATQALYQAVQQNNGAAIAKILGGPTDLASAGDEVQDKIDRELFVQKYQEMHRLRHEDDGSLTLYIGAENWPFPIPLVEKSGAWRFDADTGTKEVLFRRIGENELTAIAVCHELVAAEKQGKAANGASPEGELPANLASKVASGDPIQFEGYNFRALSTHPASGSAPAADAGKVANAAAFIAWPQEYRSSGVVTFVIRDDGVVFEKDLGANTSALASAMAAFHKDATWHVTEE